MVSLSRAPVVEAPESKGAATTSSAASGVVPVPVSATEEPALAANAAPGPQSRRRVWRTPTRDVNGDGRDEVHHRGLLWSPYHQYANLRAAVGSPAKGDGPYFIHSWGIIVGDLDADGYADRWEMLKVPAGPPSGWLPFLTFGSPSWFDAAPIEAWSSSPPVCQYLVAPVGDFDGDERDDLVVAVEPVLPLEVAQERGRTNPPSRPYASMLAFGNGRAPVVTVPLGSPSYVAPVGDLNADGCTDLLLVDADPYVVFGGGRNIEDRTRAKLGGLEPRRAPEVAGVAVGGHGELALFDCTNRDAPQLRRWIFAESALREVEPARLPQWMGCSSGMSNLGDLDGDGESDLGNLDWIVSLRDGATKPRIRPAPWRKVFQFGPWPVGDVNGDGLADVVVMQGDRENVTETLRLFCGSQSGLPGHRKTLRHSW